MHMKWTGMHQKALKIDDLHRKGTGVHRNWTGNAPKRDRINGIEFTRYGPERAK